MQVCLFNLSYEDREGRYKTSACRKMDLHEIPTKSTVVQVRKRSITLTGRLSLSFFSMSSFLVLFEATDVLFCRYHIELISYCVKTVSLFTAPLRLLQGSFFVRSQQTQAQMSEGNRDTECALTSATDSNCLQ